MKKTRILRGFLIALMACGLIFALAACSVKYKVDYVLGEHAAADATVPASAEVEDGTMLTLPAAPAAAEGWLFDGWSDGTTTYDAGAIYKVDSDTTFTATWEEVAPAVEQVTVTYALGEHAAADATVPAAQTVDAGTQVTLPAAPTAATGWQFKAWSDGTTEYAVGATFTANTNVTLTATWEAVTTPVQRVTVTYALGEHAAADVAVPAAETVTAGTEITLPAAPAAAEGWQFKAWSDGTTEYAAGATFTANSNVTLTATWEEAAPAVQQVTVTYALGQNAAADATAPAAQTVDAGTQITLPAAPAAATGYEFDGWYNGDVKIDGTTYTANASVTLTATWEAVTYTINYEGLHDATNGNPASYTVETSDITLVNPGDRTGYTFEGWYTAATAGEKVTTITTSEAKEVTLYARWTPIPYTITYEGLEGATNESNPANYTVETPDITLAAPGNRTGYTFAGWYTAETEGEQVTTIDTSKAIAVTLYARWTLNPTVSNEGEFLNAIEQAESGNSIVLSADVTLTSTTAFTLDAENFQLTIDLGGHTLTISDNSIKTEDPIGFTLLAGYTLTITNGTLAIDAPLSTNNNGTDGLRGNEATIFVDGGSTLNLTNVNYTTPVTGVFVANGTLNVTGGSIVAGGGYAIGTNASEQGGTAIYAPPTVIVKGTAEDPVELTAKGDYSQAWLNDGVAVLLNVEGANGTFEYVTFTGPRQAAIVRAGTAAFNTCTFTMTELFNSAGEYFLNGGWGSGNNMPMASLIVGDTSNTAYNEDAVVTLTGCTFTELKALGDSTKNIQYIHMASDGVYNAELTLPCADFDKVYKTAGNQDKIIVNLVHDELTHTAATPATCVELGNIEYWTCSTCKTNFSDDKGTNVIKDTANQEYGSHELSLVDRVEATCGTDGVNEHYLCSVCNGKFSDAAGKTSVTDAELKLSATGNHETYSVTYANSVLTEKCAVCGHGEVEQVLTFDKTVTTEGAFSFDGSKFTVDLSKVKLSGAAADEIIVYFKVGETLHRPTEIIEVPSEIAVIVEDTATSFGNKTDVAWFESNWKSVLKKGDSVTYSGTMQSNGANNFEAIFAQIIKEGQLVAFRIDNWVNDQAPDTVEATVVTHANTGLTITKRPRGIDWATFSSIIADCNVVVSFNWANPDLISISITAYNASGSFTQIYDATATTGSLPDYLEIGFGYEKAVVNLTRHTQCADGLYCEVCGELNGKLLSDGDALALKNGNATSLEAGDFAAKATFTLGEETTNSVIFVELHDLAKGEAGYFDFNIVDLNIWGSESKNGQLKVYTSGARPVGIAKGDYTMYAIRQDSTLYVRLEYTAQGDSNVTFAMTAIQKNFTTAAMDFIVAGGHSALTDCEFWSLNIASN